MADTFEEKTTSISREFIPSCPVCDSEDVVTLLEARDDNYFLRNNIKDQSRSFTIGKCRGCGFVFVQDPISHESHSYNDFLDSTVHTLPPPKNRHHYLLHLLDSIAARLAREQTQRDIRILEIGCGFGQLYSFALAKGYNYTAIEPAPVRHNLLEAAGLPVFKGSFAQFVEAWEQQGRRAYDVIILDNVLEHIPRPDLCIAEIKQLMNRGSYLVVVTPNLLDIRGRINRGWYERQFKPVGHVNYFTYKTMKRLLNSQDFSLVRLGRYAVSLGFACLLKSVTETVFNYYPFGLYIVGRWDSQ